MNFNSSFRPLVLMVMVSAVLAGCTSTPRTPAPVEDRTAMGRSPAPTPATPATEAVKTLPGSENAGCTDPCPLKENTQATCKALWFILKLGACCGWSFPWERRLQLDRARHMSTTDGSGAPHLFSNRRHNNRQPFTHATTPSLAMDIGMKRQTTLGQLKCTPDVIKSGEMALKALETPREQNNETSKKKSKESYQMRRSWQCVLAVGPDHSEGVA